jgi:epoxyqueuosine reductase
MNKELTAFIRSQAVRLGFTACGVSPATPLEGAAPHLKEWVRQGMHATMLYMQNNMEVRLNPSLMVRNARSVISVLFNYYPSRKQNDTDHYKIAKYAYGSDYHAVVKNRLHKLMAIIRREAGPINARAFTDSAPVLEKYLAQQAGLGWIGKNGCLINRRGGSFFFIGEIIIDRELAYDEPERDRCGSCTACLTACPTGAIVRPYVVDAGKCIAYHTIESRQDLPPALRERFRGWIFGCDICQDVCPWNRFALPHHESELEPTGGLLGMTREKWESLSEDGYKTLFAHSAVSRAGFAGLKRNIAFLKDRAIT